jgi:hypothetical protein
LENSLASRTFQNGLSARTTSHCHKPPRPLFTFSGPSFDVQKCHFRSAVRTTYLTAGYSKPPIFSGFWQSRSIMPHQSHPLLLFLVLDTRSDILKREHDQGLSKSKRSARAGQCATGSQRQKNDVSRTRTCNLRYRKPMRCHCAMTPCCCFPDRVTACGLASRLASESKADSFLCTLDPDSANNQFRLPSINAFKSLSSCPPTSIHRNPKAYIPKPRKREKSP